MAEPETIRRGDAARVKNAYLLELEIENVRCFGTRQRLDLRAPDGSPARWTLILGENGTGKTTLLQCLALALPALWHEGGATIDANSSPERLRPTVTRFLRPWEIEFDSLHRSGRDEPIKGEVKIEWANRFESAVATRDQSRWTTHPNRGSGTAFTVNAPALAYAYGASRRQGPPGVTADSGSSPTATLFDDAATLRNPEEWLLQTKLLAANESSVGQQAQARFERIQHVLTRILPGVTDVRVGLHQNGGPPRAIVEVLGPDGWVPFSALGLGYRTMTAWMVDLASRLFERYEDLQDPMQGAAVCLVDEIDLHLHPRWQRTFLDHLTQLFPNTQFIATAHSPLVVQSAPDANVIVLKRTDDGVRIERAPDAVRKWRLDQILTSELFDVPSARPPELDRLFTERDTLLGKDTLSDADEQRLAALRDEIGELSYGESPADIHAMDVIRRAAQALERSPR